MSVLVEKLQARNYRFYMNGNPVNLFAYVVIAKIVCPYFNWNAFW